MIGMIEKRYWQENKEQLNNFYPFERMEHLMNDIKQHRKKGNTNEIEYLRMIISHIGNALGLVRTIKAAENEFQSQSLKYFSSKPGNFNDYLKQIDNPDPIMKKTCDIFESTLNILERKDKEKNGNYLTMMVKRLENIFTPENIQDFDLYFYLLPALTINCVENLIVAKEKLSKKNNKDAYISDDGFIIGLTYLIKVFGQENDFNSLHWFDSAINKFKKDEQNFLSKKFSESDLQKKMSLKKVEVYKREFELLHYTFNSSVILFNEY